MSYLSSHSSIELELPTNENLQNSFINIETSDLLVHPCLITQGTTQFMLCSRIHCSNPDKPIGLSLYNIDCPSQPKLSTTFFPVKDTYTRIFSSQACNGYFAGYQTKNQITYLTLFKITGQGFKKLTSLTLNSVGMKLNTDALHFLDNNPYECLFIPGDGSLKYLDLKKKAVLSETLCNNYEGFKCHSKLRVLAVKRKEELHLMKLSVQKEILSMEKIITGHEIFQEGEAKPKVNFITQYSDLKDYVFDEENNMLYIVFAWVSWTHNTVSLSLPPSITHLRFQKWSISENNIELIDQKEIEWYHNRAQIFNLHVKGKQCLVSDPCGIFIISLETFTVIDKIFGKRLLGICKDNRIILQETNRNVFLF